MKNKTMAGIHTKLGGYDSLQANSISFPKIWSERDIEGYIDTGDFNYLSKNQFTLVEVYGASVCGGHRRKIPDLLAYTGCMERQRISL